MKLEADCVGVGGGRATGNSGKAIGLGRRTPRPRFGGLHGLCHSKRQGEIDMAADFNRDLQPLTRSAFQGNQQRGEFRTSHGVCAVSNTTTSN